MDILEWMDRVERFYEEMDLNFINSILQTIDKKSLDLETLARLERMEALVKLRQSIKIQKSSDEHRSFKCLTN